MLRVEKIHYFSEYVFNSDLKCYKNYDNIHFLINFFFKDKFMFFILFFPSKRNFLNSNLRNIFNRLITKELIQFVWIYFFYVCLFSGNYWTNSPIFIIFLSLKSYIKFIRIKKWCLFVCLFSSIFFDFIVKSKVEKCNVERNDGIPVIPCRALADQYLKFFADNFFLNC